MIDRYTKIILTILAFNTSLMVADQILNKFFPEAWAQSVLDVNVVGGQLDYETDITGGPTLKVCIDC